MRIDIVNLGRLPGGEQKERSEASAPTAVRAVRQMRWYQDGNLRLVKGYVIIDDGGEAGAAVEQSRL